ncbi:ABC transporter substrate-binding protein [Roseibium sp. HPY-6]|uniref:ABC transporter substrate-binding protein n=1 Tax=Roseibium sp. HPY-6 TaxID=3229852 RepID=UPI00338EEAEB
MLRARYQSADGQSLALAFASGELDLAFNLPVESLSMFDGARGEAVKSFPVAYQYMMWMNTRHPALEDVRVRKAIDPAVNRDDLVAAARAGKPAIGAFATSYPFAASGPLTQDLEAANALLDEAGWVKGDDGVRSKDGKRLELVLWAYPQRPDLVTFQPVVRAALAELGVSVTTQVTESPSQVAGRNRSDDPHFCACAGAGRLVRCRIDGDCSRSDRGHLGTLCLEPRRAL